MEKLSIKDVAKGVRGELLNISEYTYRPKGKQMPTLKENKFVTGVSIDSRTVKEGELFVAIKGKKVDGNCFVKDVVRGKVSTVLIERGKVKKTLSDIREIKEEFSKINLNIITAQDTLKALGDLGAYYRKKFKMPVVGITGSTGKTTTKELTATCLSVKYNVLKNKSSYNSLTGVPLTLFNLSGEHSMCVLEIGANRKGEIKRLSEIANPKVGIITNIGACHLEAFKTLEGVLKEKSELLRGTQIAIINGDDTLLRTIRLPYPLIQKKFKFGIKGSDLDLTAKDVDLKDGISFKVDGIKFKIPFIGIHNVYNALAAISAGIYFDVSLKDMSEALRNVQPMEHRDELMNIKGMRIIDSTYNANPFSMRAAIEELCVFKTQAGMKGKRLPKSRTVAILGDMLELGKNSQQFHMDIGKFLKEKNIDIIIGVGKLAKHYIEDINLRKKFSFKSSEEVIPFVKKFLEKGDIVLVKGSNAMRMSKIISSLSMR
ncbi:MAG: UDP-N-acetylmuramoyl-tripeptide--D-alanyl-D-alanine ligase [bacterium]|nr:UDP-N-acetylmuramoyl-tripeptide--D-alanyl-D-alanine ligase [bacterium]